MGALKSKVLSRLSPKESKGLLINTQLIAQQLPQVGEVVIQLLTKIEDLEVESLQKEERVKILGGGGGKKVEGEKGKTSTEKRCHTQPEKD